MDDFPSGVAEEVVWYEWMNLPYVMFTVRDRIVDASQDHESLSQTPPKRIGTMDLGNGSKTMPTIYQVISPRKGKVKEVKEEG